MNVSAITPGVSFKGKIIESGAKNDVYNYVEKNNYKKDEFKAAVKNFTKNEPKNDTISFKKADGDNYSYTRKTKYGTSVATSPIKDLVDNICYMFTPKKTVNSNQEYSLQPITEEDLFGPEN